MYYHRPRMSAIFYALGILGIFTATIGVLLAIAMYFETRGVTKDDVKDAFIASLSLGLGSLLILGLGSILNVLHDIRTEASRLTAVAQTAGQPTAMARGAEPNPVAEQQRAATDRIRRLHAESA